MPMALVPSSCTIAPDAPAPAGRATLAAVSPTSSRSCARMSAEGWCSVIPDARVEHAVEHVGDEIEEDDRRGGDHEPGHHGVRVVAQQRVDEIQAHAVEREDGLGDDRTAEQPA